ncbi:LOW QUALITY PROTEIN: hypothetical protein M513_13004 [Trichuris suis]|uniref:Integrase catalytic domain-containing protein n=1 Tax=Trichuris suis TaxID=68888 RepID=A0A085LMB3_9BILA|nr:LOW QUALITY PROTEIN: hypothetical protein M513_13004 [Trichuris suis]
MDVTHFGGRPYLTLIDCGPSRFAIWRPLRLHTSADVVGQLETVFYERGAPEELLTDNDTAFRSKAFAQLAARWNVRMRFRCAHVPSGNGIVERCHRTVKVIAARKGCSIAEAVYLYNITPRDGRTSQAARPTAYTSMPIREVDVSSKEGSQESSPYAAGDAVWVKPTGIQCDRRYQTGTVTDVISSQAVEVDGFPRHVRDLRPRAPVVDPTSALEDSQDDEIILTFPTRSETAETPSGQIDDPPEQEPRCSARIHRPRTFTCCDCTSGGSVPNNKSGNGAYAVGDGAWVQQPGRRCDSQFGRGMVTKVVSGQTVEVDGRPRHVKGIRRQTSLLPEGKNEPETRRDESAEEMVRTLFDRKKAINGRRSGCAAHRFITTTRGGA